MKVKGKIRYKCKTDHDGEYKEMPLIKRKKMKIKLRKGNILSLLC